MMIDKSYTDDGGSSAISEHKKVRVIGQNFYVPVFTSNNNSTL